MGFNFHSWNAASLCSHQGFPAEQHTFQHTRHIIITLFCPHLPVMKTPVFLKLSGKSISSTEPTAVLNRLVIYFFNFFFFFFPFNEEPCIRLRPGCVFSVKPVPFLVKILIFLLHLVEFKLCVQEAWHGMIPHTFIIHGKTHRAKSCSQTDSNPLKYRPLVDCLRTTPVE